MGSKRATGEDGDGGEVAAVAGAANEFGVVGVQMAAASDDNTARLAVAAVNYHDLVGVRDVHHARVVGSAGNRQCSVFRDDHPDIGPDRERHVWQHADIVVDDIRRARTEPLLIRRDIGRDRAGRHFCQQPPILKRLEP